VLLARVCGEIAVASKFDNRSIYNVLETALWTNAALGGGYNLLIRLTLSRPDKQFYCIK
jgi:hypothetical protein